MSPKSFSMIPVLQHVKTTSQDICPDREGEDGENKWLPIRVTDYHFPLRALYNATRNECQIFRGHLSQ